MDFNTKYNYEFKCKCVELFRQGQWPEVPKGVKEHTFYDQVRKWNKIALHGGMEALRPKETHKYYSPDEKMGYVIRAMASGKSVRQFCLDEEVTDGLLCRWIQKFKLCGYNGFIETDTERSIKDNPMKKKRNINNPRKIEETEYEELLRLRAENAYIKTEIEVIKKEIALREEKEAALLKAKKQRLLKNSENKDMN